MTKSKHCFVFLFSVFLLLPMISLSGVINNQSITKPSADVLQFIAEDSEEIREIGNWTHGVSSIVHYYDDIVYHGEGSYLQLIDISNHDAPELLSELYLDGTVQCVDVYNDYAFVGTGYYNDEATEPGVWIIDTSNPSSPKKCLFYNTSGLVTDVRYNNSLLYFNNGNYFEVLNVSDPENPEQLDSYNVGSSIYQFDFQDEVIALAAQYSDLIFLNASDPENLDHIVTYDSPYAGGIRLDGNTAFLGAAHYGFQSLNITDLSNIQLINTTNVDYQYYRVFLNGDYAFVCRFGGGVVMVDISEITNMTEVYVGFYGNGRSVGMVDLYENYMIAPDSRNGIYIMDISNPLDVTISGFYGGESSSGSVAFRGDYAYVGHYSNGLSVIDISIPSEATKVGYYGTYMWDDRAQSMDTYNMHEMEIHGNFLYAADGERDFKIFDISNREVPLLEHTIELTGGVAYGLAVNGDFAYLADMREGLRIINVDDPFNHFLVSDFPVECDWTCDVSFKGNIAYLSDGWGTIYVIDVSDPINPISVTNLTVSPSVRSIEVQGDYAFIGKTNGFEILDISTATSPVSVSNYTVGTSGQLTVDDGLGFFITNSYFSIINITDVMNPVELAKLNTSIYTYPTNPDNICVNQGRIAIAFGSYGVRFYEYDLNSDGAYSQEEYQASRDIPTINHPADATLNVSVSGDFVVWEPYSNNPFWYEIWADDEFHDAGAWNSTSEFIVFNKTGFSNGEYVITVTVWNRDGESVSDEVIVTIVGASTTTTTTTETTTSTTTSDTDTSPTPTNQDTYFELISIIVTIGSLVVIVVIGAFICKSRK